MKSLFLSLALLLVSGVSFGQQLINDSTFVSSKGIRFKVKDDLVIGYPSNAGEFSFIVNDTKRKLGLLSKVAGAAGEVGSGVEVVGLGKGSAGAIRTGVTTMGAAGVAGGVGNAGQLLLPARTSLPARNYGS